MLTIPHHRSLLTHNKHEEATRRHKQGTPASGETIVAVVAVVVVVVVEIILSNISY